MTFIVLNVQRIAIRGGLRFGNNPRIIHCIDDEGVKRMLCKAKKVMILMVVMLFILPLVV